MPASFINRYRHVPAWTVFLSTSGLQLRHRPRYMETILTSKPRDHLLKSYAKRIKKEVAAGAAALRQKAPGGEEVSPAGEGLAGYSAVMEGVEQCCAAPE